jgi:hypothetical protein
MTKYQAYAWNGEKYLPMSVPIYETEQEAIEETKRMILDKSNKSILKSIRLHWQDKPIIAVTKEVYL